jgi:hypothetical protein
MAFSGAVKEFQGNSREPSKISYSQVLGYMRAARHKMWHFKITLNIFQVTCYEIKT